MTAAVTLDTTTITNADCPALVPTTTTVEPTTTTVPPTTTTSVAPTTTTSAAPPTTTTPVASTTTTASPATATTTAAGPVPRATTTTTALSAEDLGQAEVAREDDAGGRRQGTSELASTGGQIADPTGLGAALVIVGLSITAAARRPPSHRRRS